MITYTSSTSDQVCSTTSSSSSSSSFSSFTILFFLVCITVENVFFQDFKEAIAVYPDLSNVR